jgi:hypothetical protein
VLTGEDTADQRAWHLAAALLERAEPLAPDARSLATVAHLRGGDRGQPGHRP